ncbi:MAG: GH116 family glycosyl-hydrolase, partial [Verrucomicrobia bacterium]|nr:GH116 family glycosyl-hydrolase [Verrucomicrobiota bacterium]
MLWFLQLACLRAEQSTPYTAYVPADKHLDPQWVRSLTAQGERKVFTGDELKYLAMPCGGIGAGELSIRGDGQLATWCILNEVQFGNANGAHYLNPRVEDKRLEQGFAVSVRPAGQPARVLQLNSADFDDLRLIGEYPIATLEYHRRNQDLPVSIRSEVFSPFVPLSVRDSANPVTVLSYTVTNISDKSAEVALAGWLENFALPGEGVICNPGGSFGGFTCDCFKLPRSFAAVRRNRVIQENGLTSVLLEVQDPPSAKQELPVRDPIQFETFERESWGPAWHPEGDAFGSGPLKVSSVRFNLPILNHEGAYVATSFHSEGQENKEGRLISKPFRIERRHILFRIGGGAYPDRTCLNLR